MNKPTTRDDYNAYMRKYIGERYHRRRNEAKAKLGGKCAACGATENLEFDHVDHRSKTAEIAKVWTYSNKKFWAEIKKCQLLCESCHREKTYRDLGWKKAKGVHGAPGSHRYCKCELCMKAWRDYQKAHRKPSAHPHSRDIVHGTCSGYRKERRRGIPNCGPCRAAIRDEARKRRGSVA